jgi:hypothetical protein
MYNYYYTHHHYYYFHRRIVLHVLYLNLNKNISKHNSYFACFIIVLMHNSMSKHYFTVQMS